MSEDLKTAQKNSKNKKESRPASMQKACKKIAPLWSLENFVAVNPYLGFAETPFKDAAHRLSQLGNIEMTLPVSFYQNAIRNGDIEDRDLEKAITDDPDTGFQTLGKFLQALDEMEPAVEPSPTVDLVMDVAAEVTGKNWSSLFVDCMTSWAAAYFDEGQALWMTTDNHSDIFTAWRVEAEMDPTPEIMGLKGFRSHIQKLPDDPIKAALHSLDVLKVPEESLEFYLHGLLLRIGGWSSYVARFDWDANLEGKEANHLQLFLCNLICWEAALYQSLKSINLKNLWEKAKGKLNELQQQERPERHQQIKLILQQAFDNACERSLIERFRQKPQQEHIRQKERADVQAIFCIDVRSEVFRRNFEMTSPTVETIGFAGFFGFPISFQPIGHGEGQPQCPVLISPGPKVKESMEDSREYEQAVSARKLRRQLMKAWKSFKLGAIACFSFMGPVGLAYLFKMFTDAFGISRPVKNPDRAGFTKQQFERRDVLLSTEHDETGSSGIPMKEQVEMAKGALKAMSLTDNFARIVLIAGHGSNTVNNPHASGLDCGACGGRTGEANAKVAARILNDPEVRGHLKHEGIRIPDDTLFIAALHDTTTDQVTLFNTNRIDKTHQHDLENLKTWLKEAGRATRTERASRFNINKDEDVEKAIFRRSKDWSQVRPEWGLAGCNAFIVAPRERTANIDLGGKSFLHNYDWKQDEDFSVLELIMTAPMVVTSWINLQYYASTVDNKTFGSGNKTLHNVTGGIGVLEGYGGDLRTGLPWQSVHDGDRYQHLPQRLNVVIEAPIHAMNAILENHPSVKNLCDNGWLNLLAMDEDGQIRKRYAGDRKWKAVEEFKMEMMT